MATMKPDVTKRLEKAMPLPREGRAALGASLLAGFDDPLDKDMDTAWESVSRRHAGSNHA